MNVFGMDAATTQRVLAALPQRMSEQKKIDFLRLTLLPALNKHYHAVGVGDMRTDDLLFCLEEIEDDAKDGSLEAEAIAVSPISEPVPPNPSGEEKGTPAGV
eukprot:843543-Prorocentrum_minimum.AAC.1